jgi:two-component system chemotaxis response regulator CheY
MPRILIVDDEESIRSLLQDILGSNGYEVDGVGSAHEAFAKLAEKSYDLVMMDENMPLMTGSQAVIYLRSHPKFRSLPILMCTSRLPDKNIGVNGYIDKPIDLKNLLETVGKILSPRRLTGLSLLLDEARALQRAAGALRPR